MGEVDSFQCNQCSNSFSRKSTLNRHLRNIHNVKLEPQAIGKCRIKCILCSFDQVIAMFPTYKDYNKHLAEVHQINVCLSRKSFVSKETFDLWCAEDKRNVNYTIQNCVTTQCGKMIYYNCNRSDSKGFRKQGTKNVLKAGGSIKIQGTCPSRIIANFIENDYVIVQYFETHLGHEEDVRAQRLTKKEQIYLVDQLKQGVSKRRIIANARNLNLPDSGVPGRINSISMNDLSNLSRRHDVKYIKHRDDLVATSIKVEELNSGEKNCDFLIDNIDIPILTYEDALVGTEKATKETEEFSMGKRESNETKCIDGNRRREIFRERFINLLDEICLADEDSFNFFERGLNSLELQLRQKLKQITSNRKGIPQRCLLEKKRRL